MVTTEKRTTFSMCCQLKCYSTSHDYSTGKKKAWGNDTFGKI